MANEDDNNARPVAIGVVFAVLAVLSLLTASFFFYLRRRRQQRRLRQSQRLQQQQNPFPASSSSTSLIRRSIDLLQPQKQRKPSLDHLRITPFGAPPPQPGGQTPIFHHEPGTNMRIATRRADGAWDFGDPFSGTVTGPSQFGVDDDGGAAAGSPGSFRPAGIADLDNVPSPSPSSLRASRNPFLFPPVPRPVSPGAKSVLSVATTNTVSTMTAKEREARGYGYGAKKDPAAGGGEYGFEVDEEVLPPPAYAYGHPHADPHSPRI